MVKWPAKLPAGKVYENPIIQLDILPTCLAVSGAEPDAPQKPLDGVNLMPYLTGQDTSRPHETLYWRFGPQWAIRHGNYKLVQGAGQAAPGLYNLAADISEQKDLTAAEPSRVTELKSLYEKWNAEQAEPKWKPNPAAKNKKKAGKKGKAKAVN
jgi:arylsulfatase A-like enzyme